MPSPLRFTVVVMSAGKPDKNGVAYTRLSLANAAVRLNQKKGKGLSLPDNGIFIEAYVEGDDLNVVFQSMTTGEEEKKP